MVIVPIMENQIKKKMGTEMETGNALEVGRVRITNVVLNRGP